VLLKQLDLPSERARQHKLRLKNAFVVLSLTATSARLVDISSSIGSDAPIPLMAIPGTIFLGLFFFLCLDVRDRIERQGRMSVSASGAHFRGHPDGFHDFLGRRPMAQSCAGVAADAIWTLRHMGDRNRDQLLGFRSNRTVSEYALAEGSEGLGWPRCQSVSLLGDLPSRLRIHLFVF
jgi:hypothetical protein